ncbi:MAG: hypothetical protein ABIQ60_00920 [Burkholderiaceae bacterium]
MALIACNNPRFFDKCARVEWFAPTSNFGESAKFPPDVYMDTGAVITLTMIPAGPMQSISVSTCGPQPAERCNVQAGTSLLLADNNTTGAPISLRFHGAGVRAVGAFVVAPHVAFGTDFAPHLWALGDAGGPSLHVPGPQGLTGDIWTQLGDQVAPFVGVRATGGERITVVQFDAVHPGAFDFALFGISTLYCVV